MYPSNFQDTGLARLVEAIFVDQREGTAPNAGHRPPHSDLHWRSASYSFSLIVQRRDRSVSQLNCKAGTLLSVLTPPAIVRHLPVLAFTSISSLATVPAYVTVPDA